MSYAQYQGDGRRNYAGIAAVVVLHVIVIYALANGLGRKVIEVLKKPLDVAIIEDVKIPPPPPPPPQVKQTPPPTNAPPPPAYVPPPEVVVRAAPVENTVTATAQTPPPPPVVAAPPAPPAPPAPVEPARPKVVDANKACPNYKEALGRLQAQADKQGWSGDIVVEVIVGAGGEVSNVSVVSATTKVFSNAVVAAVSRLPCEGQGQPVRFQIPLAFRRE